MSLLFSNPELLRYARTQLRPNKLLIAAITCAVISTTIVLVLLQSESRNHGVELLLLVFGIQAFVLAVGGGVACLNSIYSEKDHNTFDYQRITRLSSLELSLGKLFGAPLLMYFICLCFVPLTFYAAALANATPYMILAAYIVLFVASLAFHSLTLLLSLLTVKGSQVTGILVCLLLFGLYSVNPFGGILRINSLGPFAAANFATAHSWNTPLNGYDPLSDWFFGIPIHHFFVLIAINLFFVVCFRLATVRNIKRDPQRYEVFSPLQSLLFALILNFLLLGFFVGWTSPLDSQSFFLTMNLFLFGFLGIALLRNRERSRSSLMSPQPQRLLAHAFWPAPILLAGTVLVNVLILAQLVHVYSTTVRAVLPFALLRGLAFILWLAGNFQLLQCMTLRRGKHPLILGVLYLAIYYFCACPVLAAMGCFRVPRNIPVGSLFVPSTIYLLDPSTWQLGPRLWIAGLAIQFILIILFTFIHYRQLTQLKSQLATASKPT